jgi:alkanesulfonate monooxygenase SsuD/methylene tetrahydromethanopterin reductase-like flavin-dependent oxidoreductase (luciferase family)
MVTGLTYVAATTERVRFGPRVSPVSFRDPVMLARQAAALDELSGGRFSLGLGAGWMAREHEMFGYDLGDIPTRMDRFAEALEVTTLLFRSEEPVSFAGRFFCLKDAVLPEPKRPGGPEIAIGGNGPKRTMPLVARYADAWNMQGASPEQVKERSARLDELIVQAGRRPRDVRRVYNAPIVCFRSPEELATRLEKVRRLKSAWRAMTDEELLAVFTTLSWPVGSPEEVVALLRAYEAAGIDEVEAKWVDPDDVAGLELLAGEVLPHIA